MFWFDAHLDLACLAVCGRDMTKEPGAAGGPTPPAGVTLSSLRAGGVRFALATIFIEQVDEGTERSRLTNEQYVEGDLAHAARRARAQLEVYETWRDRGLVRLDFPACLRFDPDVGEVRGGMGVSEVVVPPLDERAKALADGTPRLGILMEGADSIAKPEDVAWWKSRGVCAVGLAWARSSHCAQGNMGRAIRGHSQSVGLSEIGREMVRAIDGAGLVHDLSHLSDIACDEVLSLTDRPVIASHSNCRALLGGANQRHLRDETIREIVRRGGVIGLNLFSKFLRVEPPHEGAGRPTIDHAVAHVERVCELVGHRRAVGLGSDMDGGFSALSMCEGIERPEHLVRLTEALSARGWSDEDVTGFTHLNWLRFWDSWVNPALSKSGR